MRQVALITGSTSGIGKATALLFAQEGYCVIVTGRNAGRGAQVVKTITEAGGKAYFLAADLRIEQKAKQLISFAASKGELSVLVNCAGGNNDVSAAEHFATNYNSAVYCSTAALTSMQSGASIIHVTSICATSVLAHEGGAYSDAKAALSSFSKGLAKKVATRGVRVNAIAPGFTKTPDWGDLDLETEQNLSKKVPLLGRFLYPEEVAQAIYSLSQLPGVTGTELVVDGGTTNLNL